MTAGGESDTVRLVSAVWQEYPKYIFDLTGFDGAFVAVCCTPPDWNRLHVMAFSSRRDDYEVDPRRPWEVEDN